MIINNYLSVSEDVALTGRLLNLILWCEVTGISRHVCSLSCCYMLKLLAEAFVRDQFDEVELYMVKLLFLSPFQLM